MKKIILIIFVLTVLNACKKESVDFRDTFTGSWNYNTMLIQSTDYLKDRVDEFNHNEDVTNLKCRITKKKGSPLVLILTTLKNGKESGDKMEITINPDGEVAKTSENATFTVSDNLYYNGSFVYNGTLTNKRIYLSRTGRCTWYFSPNGDGKITDTGSGDLRATIILKR